MRESDLSWRFSVSMAHVFSHSEQHSIQSLMHIHLILQTFLYDAEKRMSSRWAKVFVENEKEKDSRDRVSRLLLFFSPPFPISLVRLFDTFFLVPVETFTFFFPSSYTHRRRTPERLPNKNAYQDSIPMDSYWVVGHVIKVLFNAVSSHFRGIFNFSMKREERINILK